MKLRPMSDLHLEGHQYKYKSIGEDVLLLVGDIHTRQRHHELIEQVPESVQIIMVRGNHETYHSDVETVNKYLYDLQMEYDNFHYLDNSSMNLNDVEFFGGMMCTDFLLHGIANEFTAKHSAKDFINDFRCSYLRPDDDTRWSTENHINEHRKFRRELSGWLRNTEGKKRVVMSHFVPHSKMIHSRWGGVENALNAYFTSDMERYMGWEGYWFCGHTHDCGDQMIGDTRVICNPRGYRDENPMFNDQLIVEI